MQEREGKGERTEEGGEGGDLESKKDVERRGRLNEQKGGKTKEKGKRRGYITNHTPMESLCLTCNLIPRCGGRGGESAPGLHLHLIAVATSLYVYIVYW